MSHGCNPSQPTAGLVNDRPDPGALDEVLVPAGRDARYGEWLALVRPA